MSSNEFLSVLPGPKAEAGRVIIAETDDAHPGNHEVFLSAPREGDPEPKPVQVGRTPLVMQRLRDGELIEAGAVPMKADKPADKPTAPTKSST